MAPRAQYDLYMLLGGGFMWQTSFIGIIIASQWSIRLSSHFASKGSIWLNSHFQRRDENKKLDPWLVKFCSCMSFHASLILIIHEVLLSMGVTFVSCILVFWPKCVFLHVCRRPVKKGFFLLLLALFSKRVCVCFGMHGGEPTL